MSHSTATATPIPCTGTIRYTCDRELTAPCAADLQIDLAGGLAWFRATFQIDYQISFGEIVIADLRLVSPLVNCETGEVIHSNTTDLAKIIGSNIATKFFSELISDSDEFAGMNKEIEDLCWRDDGAGKAESGKWAERGAV